MSTNEELVNEVLVEGTIVTCNHEGGFIGKIVGLASDMGLAGKFYIVKMVNRGGKAWIEHPYSCVVVPRGMLQVE